MISAVADFCRTMDKLTSNHNIIAGGLGWGGDREEGSKGEGYMYTYV